MIRKGQVRDPTSRTLPVCTTCAIAYRLYLYILAFSHEWIRSGIFGRGGSSGVRTAASRPLTEETAMKEGLIFCVHCEQKIHCHDGPPGAADRPCIVSSHESI